MKNLIRVPLRQYATAPNFEIQVGISYEGLTYFVGISPTQLGVGYVKFQYQVYADAEKLFHGEECQSVNVLETKITVYSEGGYLYIETE